MKILLWLDTNDRDMVILGYKAEWQSPESGNCERYVAWSSMHIDGVSDLFDGDVLSAVQLLSSQPAGTAVEVELATLRVDGEDVSGIDKPSELVKAEKVIEVYEWLFEHGCCVCKDATIREDGQVWVVADVDGEVVARGRDAEEAAWGAWDRAKYGIGQNMENTMPTPHDVRRGYADRKQCCNAHELSIASNLRCPCCGGLASKLSPQMLEDLHREKAHHGL